MILSSLSKKYGIVVAFAILILFVNSTMSLAQLVGGAAVDFTRFTYHDKLPKYLLSRKSMVLVSAPPSEENPDLRSDWKSLAESCHAYFRKMNIDAIAYFYLDDIFGNVVINEEFTKKLTNREIKYIIFIDHKRSVESTTGNRYTITVTPYNNENTLFSLEQNAWKIEGDEIKEILVEMNKEVIRQEMSMTNYLIPEYPEFFSSTRVIKGRRIPTYAMDLKVETLVVPRFQKMVLEENVNVDDTYKQRVIDFNLAVDAKNRRLEEIMSTYSPLKYELIDEITAQEIYNRGHQFALMKIEGPGKMIKESLGFELTPNETDYVTLKADIGGARVYPIPVEAVVTKFYVQHVFTRDTYVGLNWDADKAWEESLINFIFHMKKILKIKS